MRPANVPREDLGRAPRTRATRLILICTVGALLLVASLARDSSSTGARSLVAAQSPAGGAQPVATSKKMRTSEGNVVEARRAGADFAVGDFDNAAWRAARAVSIERYWSGELAPAGRRAEARLVWTDAALYVRFVARQGEPLVVSEKPRLAEKTLGLWDRDVCELFVAPNAAEPERYFEFEVAPTGEWLDARIHQLPERRESDFDYHSGATFAARAAQDSVTLTMRVPWSAFGVAPPRAGAQWRANLYRCVGAGATRGYLAWQPTLTPQPSFHVPEKFGWLRFAD